MRNLLSLNFLRRELYTIDVQVFNCKAVASVSNKLALVI
jgi:hypothetical protein